MSQTKKRHLFPIILLSLSALFLVGVLVFCLWLNGVLAEYEGSLPIHVAEQVMKDYFSSPSLDKALTAFTDKNKFEVERISRYFETVYGEFTLTTATSTDESTAKYTVSYNQQTVATFTVKKTGEVTKHGYELYAFDSATIKLPHEYVQTIMMPSDYYLEIDSLTTETALIENGIETESFAHMPDGVNGITLKKVKITSFVKNPVITVKSSYGTVIEGTYDAENELTNYAFVYDEPMPIERVAYIKEALEAYAIYAQDDSYFGAISPYLDPSSELYENVRLLDVWTVVTHDSWAFEDEYVDDYCSYGDGSVFSVHYTVTHILKRQWFDDYKDYIDLYVYFRKVGGKWLIYDVSQD